jgi:hypothetical protein
VRSSERAVLGGEILERALHPAAGGSPDAVADLITLAEGRRPPLEAAQSLLIDRLHRRSDDFDATRALCSVSAALSRLGWDMPVPSQPRRWGRRSAGPVGDRRHD